MKCPVCTAIDLEIAERQGVEIDYCPECRGVWLDRGELDKIIERSGSHRQDQNYCGKDDHQIEESVNRGYRGHDDHDHDHRDYRGDKHHKRKSLLKELFDF